MRIRLLSLLLLLPSLQAGVVYSHRVARFFGDATGRETLVNGSYTPATSLTTPVSFTTGGATPTTLQGSVGTQASPLLLTTSTHVNASASTSLTFNTDLVTPTDFVSISTSSLQETGIVISGGTGIGYFLPIFHISGAFQDTHPNAGANITICTGNGTCPLTSLANSGSASTVDEFYTPPVGQYSLFTFDVPFNYLLYAMTRTSSIFSGTLQPGNLGAEAAFRIVGFTVLDENQFPVRSATIESDLFNPAADVPEPSGFCLAGAAVLLLACLFRQRAPIQAQRNRQNPALR